MLSALLHLQSVERRINQVKDRLRARQRAIGSQERRVNELTSEFEALHEQSIQLRKESDTLELDLRQKEEKVTSLRGALNTAKTNKEYAAILTEINTIKADNAKIEERVLKVMQDAETVGADAEKIQERITAEDDRLREIRKTNKEEVERLTGMLEELAVERTEATGHVPPEKLAMFERISEKIEGDAMAPLEIHGKKPPYDYICGGCFMSLNAEHANALRTRDEIRTCDSCGRILFMENDPAAKQEQKS